MRLPDEDPLEISVKQEIVLSRKLGNQQANPALQQKYYARASMYDQLLTYFPGIVTVGDALQKIEQTRVMQSDIEDWIQTALLESYERRAIRRGYPDLHYATEVI